MCLNPLGSLFFFFKSFLSVLVGYQHHTNVLAAGSLRVVFSAVGHGLLSWALVKHIVEGNPPRYNLLVHAYKYSSTLH